MFNPFNINDWYWLADDSRVYASARQVIVDNTDPEYLAWVALQNNAVPWPRDDAGEQTDAALQAVLLSSNIYVNLTYYSAAARLTEEEGGIIVNGFPVRTDRVSQSLLSSAYAHAKEDPAWSFSYKLDDGSFVVLDAIQIPLLSTGVSVHTQSCFTAEAQLATDIAAGTVTTREEVDARYSAIPDVATLRGFPQRT